METNGIGLNEVRHFCATTYVVRVTPGGGQVLLHRHPKINSWLPPGGHVNENESPAAAAEREVMEEAGIKVRFLTPKWAFNIEDDERTRAMPAPHAIQEELISPGHYHMDFIYVARQVSGAAASPQFRWVDAKTLEQLDMLPNARTLARKAIALAEEGKW